MTTHRASTSGHTRICVAVLLLGLSFAPSVALGQTDHVIPIDEVVTRVVVRATASSESADLGSLRPGEQAELLGGEIDAPAAA